MTSVCPTSQGTVEGSGTVLSSGIRAVSLRGAQEARPTYRSVCRSDGAGDRLSHPVSAHSSGGTSNVSVYICTLPHPRRGGGWLLLVAMASFRSASLIVITSFADTTSALCSTTFQPGDTPLS